jgi:putative DNA-invertase from lambdoid prophage Rac
MRVFAYCRVSTDGQVTSNQIMEIAGAGFTIAPHRIVEECISGSTQALQRPMFSRLLDKLEPDDILVVSKLDRLGRSAPDVRATVELLAARGVRVHCLAIGNCDLTSSAGKMTMQIIAAVAEFELDLLRERVNAGLKRAVAQGVRLGRKPALTNQQRSDAIARVTAGETISAVARSYAVSRTTIIRLKHSSQKSLEATSAAPM